MQNLLIVKEKVKFDKKNIYDRIILVKGGNNMKFKYIWREAIHGALIGGFKLMRNFKLQISDKPKVDGPVIYAAVHTNSYDAPVVMDAIKDHTYLFASDEVRHKIAGLCFELNGVIYVHREDKASRKASAIHMCEVLNDGKSVLIFPEGSWNTTPSSPILNLSWGVIDISQKTNAPIIPIVTEYYDDKCIIRFGEPMTCPKLKVENVSEEEKKKLEFEHKKDLISKLEEQFATIKWEIWEQHGGVYNREDGDLNAKTLKKYKDLYPAVDYEYDSRFHYNKVKYLEDVCPINVVEINKQKTKSF